MTTSPSARPSQLRRLIGVFSAAAMTAALVLAGGPAVVAEDGQGSVVVTTEVLGSIVAQLADDAAEVSVIMPPGANPHSYEPSARDAERILGADVVVSNGLDLEEALLSVLESAAAEGVTWFEAADHVVLRDLADPADGEPDDTGNHDHEHAAEDPHIWTDPLAMRDVVLALEPVLVEAGVDIGAGASTLAAELETLDAEIAAVLAAVPAEARQLVTGHRSLGYFADRYDFELVGTVVPSLSTSGEPTAREMAELIEDIRRNDVVAVFSEVGTPESVAQAVASDSGATLVPLPTSQLPAGGTYEDLIREIASGVAEALTP